MENLKKAFYDVMYKYQKPFSEEGVMANLNEWSKNKRDLLTILRRHPNWREEELAVVFDLSEGRGIDRDIVDEAKYELNLLVEEILTDRMHRGNFNRALHAATIEYRVTPSDDKIEAIKQAGGIKCSAGQKTSRIIGRLCGQFGIDRHKDYNAVFARLSDAFSPKDLNRTGVLSIHPCDFLEMSNKDNSWSSCHGLDHGGYQAGCLSYLTDSVSMIFFTVDNKVTEAFHKAPKRTREIFCYQDNVLLQSRLYPADESELISQYRHLVQGSLALCLGKGNQWVLKNKKDMCKKYFVSAAGSQQYPDYNYYARISLFKGADSNETMRIGHKPLCVCCGRPYSNSGQLKCTCESVVVCADCGKTVPIENTNYINGAYFCNSCMHICASCKKTERTDMYPAFDRCGHLLEVCSDCYETMTAACASCSVRSVCEMVSGARFCEKTSIVPAVA